MKQFIRNVFLFILFLMTIVLFQFLVFRFLLSHKVDYKLGEEINTIVIGNSQPQTCINDSILPNVFNIALGGDPMYFSYIKLKKLLPHNPQIKNVILGGVGSIYDAGFYEVPRMESKFKLYYYIIDIPDYWSFVKYNPEAFASGMTGIIYKIRPKNIINTVKISQLDIGGYGGMEREFKQTDIDVYNKNDYFHLKVVPIQAKYLNEIVELCKKYQVKLIVLDCPIHPSLASIQKPGRAHYLDYVSKALPGVEFWDYEAFPLTDKDFADCIHLNRKGARKFSLALKDKIDSL